MSHEQRAEVGVTEPELAELARVVGDLLGGIVGVADDDLLRGEHHLDGVLERLDVERVLVVDVEVREQVDAREVARRVVQVHVLRVVHDHRMLVERAFVGDRKVVRPFDLEIEDGYGFLEDDRFNGCHSVQQVIPAQLDSTQLVAALQRDGLHVAAVAQKETVFRGAAKDQSTLSPDLDEVRRVTGDPDVQDPSERVPANQCIERAYGGERLTRSGDLLEQIEADHSFSCVDERVADEAARVAAVDAPGVGRGVPAVDRGVELHARVGALPRGLRDLPHQLARLHGLDRLARGNRLEVPVAVLEHRLHELVGDAHRVVCVLVLDRVAVLTVEVHVEPGVTQRARLALLDGLAPDELFDVRMVGVEDDHLRGATGLSA